MKITHVKVTLPSGKEVTGTQVIDGTRKIVFTAKLTKEEAERAAMKYRTNPRRFKRLSASVKKFQEFNWKPPRRLLKKQIDLSVPLVRIGRVPEITYMSDKEGKMQGYRHKTKRMPTLYAHPTKPLFVMIGGSIKVKDWLYD